MNTKIEGVNLIVNPHFSNGNTGFVSDYSYAAINTTAGEYFIGSNPVSWNPLAASCVDHTTGTGNMMLVNGSGQLDLRVWEQTVTVTPNTNYAFSVWVQSLYPPNPALLNFSINGKSVSTAISPDLATCTWKQVFTTWNSGNNTSATISIVNKNSVWLGNDFALDDISFSSIQVKTEKVVVAIDSIRVDVGDNLKVCKNDTVMINAVSSATGTYVWTPSNGLNDASVLTPLAFPATTTNYKLLATSAKGCIDSAFVNVKVSPGPGPLSMGTVKQSCNQFSFTGTSGTEGSIGFWLWSFGDGTIALSQNTTHTFTANGTYQVKLTATDTTGCKDSSASTQVLVNFPEVLATGGTTICKGDTTQLSVSSADSFQWQPTQGLSSSTGTVINAFPTSTTAYVVTGTSSGCNAADTITVTVVSGPPISISNDTTICSGKKLQLFANGAANYTWSPAGLLSSPTVSNPEASPLGTTMFYLTATSPALLCSSQDSVLVTVAPAPQFNIATPQPVCKDGKAQLNASGGTNYAWQPATLLTSTNTPSPQTLALNQNTNFTVKILDAFCKDSTVLSTTVTLLSRPIITASKSNDIDCATPRAILSAAGADSYTWSSSSGLPLYLDNASGSTVTANPSITKLYTVTGKDNATSCAGTDTITIIVNKQGTSGTIYVPSAFSPNGDGLNDCFRVSSTGTPLTKFRLSIYNRYGEMIYKTAKAGDCWDGKYKGKLQENGNYVYILWIDDDCSNEKFKKGNVVLTH